MDEYPCEKCGICCTKIDTLKNTIYHDYYVNLDKGNSTCKFFDTKTKLCTIYQTIPIICNGKLLYKKFFSEKYSIEKFYAMNKKICKRLQQEEK